MDTAREYRQRAADCLRLANGASDAYVKVALVELASEFHGMAKTVEARMIHVHRRQAREKSDTELAEESLQAPRARSRAH